MEYVGSLNNSQKQQKRQRKILSDTFFGTLCIFLWDYLGHTPYSSVAKIQEQSIQSFSNHHLAKFELRHTRKLKEKRQINK